MDSLPPIPTPAAQRWREFRIRVMPLFFFAGVALAVGFLWREVAVPPTFAVGFVETNGATVSVPVAGLLTHMTVKRFEQVKAGQELGHLVVKDPKLLSAELGVIKAEVVSLRTSMDPLLRPAQVILDYNQMRLTAMQQRADQARQRIDLRQAEYEFKNIEILFKEGVATETQYLQVKARMESLRTAVDEREKLIQNLDQDLNSFTVPRQSTNGNALEAAIGVEEAKLKELEAAASPVSLTAPIDGMVSIIMRHSGEYLNAGEVVLTISGTQSDQIIGFVRQPMSIQPKIGMPVQVRSRTPKRHTATATVVQIGGQMEAFSVAMLPTPSAGSQRAVEWGLPIQVSLPPALRLIPGELVDLIFEK